MRSESMDQRKLTLVISLPHSRLTSESTDLDKLFFEEIRGDVKMGSWRHYPKVTFVIFSCRRLFWGWESYRSMFAVSETDLTRRDFI